MGFTAPVTDLNQIGVNISDSLSNLIGDDVVLAYNNIKKQASDFKLEDLNVISFANDSTTIPYETDPENVSSSNYQYSVDKLGDAYKYNIEKAESIVGKLWDTVAPMGVHAWDMVVRIQIAKGIVLLIPFIFISTILIILIRNKNRPDFKTFDFKNALWTSSVFILTIAFFQTSEGLYMGLMHLFAPEWYAFKEIMGLIKG